MNTQHNEEEILRVKKLIIKKVLAEATEAEIKELEVWAGDSTERKMLIERLTDNDYVERGIAQARHVKRTLSPAPVSIRQLVRAAAILLLAASTALFLYNIATRNDQQINTSKITLVTGRGDLSELSDPSALAKLAKKGIMVYGDTLDYTLSVNGGRGEHTLHVPRKKTFTIKLADGTVVKLNSESSLTYPARFANNEREVKLDGEAFFQVSKDVSRPFLASTTFQHIKVLGTAFNIKAYSYETKVVTTLVEGEVEVRESGERNNGEMERCGKEEGQAVQLVPGLQYVYEKKSGTGEVKEVDVNKYISWKEGIYYFESERLEDIMNNLSRWYGVNVMFRSDTLKELVLSGRLRRDETPDNLIRTIDNLESVEMIRSDNLIIIR
jgi:hypothetical protein